MDSAAVRKFALSMPDATEEPHFHYSSFRIDGKIFATMPPSNELLHVFVPEEDREAAVSAYPKVCQALNWGKRVVGVRVELAGAKPGLVEDLIRAAYEAKAAKR